jgi:penicillin amidase
LLDGWRGSLDRGSAPAALYETWSPLLAAAFTQAFVPEADRGAGSGRMSTDRILDLLEQAGLSVREPGTTAWVDGTPRPGRKIQPPNTILRARVVEVLTGQSLADAWRQMKNRQGPDPVKWAWGEMHRASFEHPLAFTADRQAIMNLPAVPRGGDGTTPNATTPQRHRRPADSGGVLPRGDRPVELGRLDDHQRVRGIWPAGKPALRGPAATLGRREVPADGVFP